MQLTHLNKWFKRALLLLLIAYGSTCLLSVMFFEAFKYKESVDCRAINYNGMMSDAYIMYNIILWVSPNFIAKKYSTSQNEIAKTYAASLLCNRGNKACLALFQQYLISEEMVNYRCGCLILKDKIHDVIYWARESKFLNHQLDSIHQENVFQADHILREMNNYRVNQEN